MKSLCILSIIFIAFCTSLNADNDPRVDYLNVLRINNEELLPILDGIIKHERGCVYYTAKLYFSIRSRTVKDTITEFQIGAFGSILADFGNNEYYKGCFEHNGHWFFVEGQELNESIFIKTNQKESFAFYKPEGITSDGKIILRIIEDDTFSFWIYHYIDAEFTFKEMYNTYCKSLTPFDK
jgi:hypothetical protein